jgi:hypothetical protein
MPPSDKRWPSCGSTFKDEIMELGAHQRILLGLLRSNYRVRQDDDAYFHQVARSGDLQEARGNIFLWRVYVLERTCVLTVALLRQRKLLEPALQAFISSHNVSPFREYQPLAFLASLANHPDHVIVSVSQFELALMKVRAGDPASYAVAWRVDPQRVLNSLAQELALPALQDEGAYLTRLSRGLPHGFEITTVDKIEAEASRQASPR